MKKLQIVVLCLTIGLFSGACQSFLAIDLSPQLIESEDVFADNESATAAVNGVYTHMRVASLALCNGGFNIYTGLAGDELQTVSQHGVYSPFYLNNIDVSNSYVANQLWGTPYQTIYRCNTVIDRLENSEVLSDPIRNQLLGEMKLTRAMHYYHLANVFGDIPLVLNIHYYDNALLGRAPTGNVFDQVVTDLADAEKLMYEEYMGESRERPRKMSATALLARIYLYLGDYPKAATSAEKVIQSGLFALENDLNDVFTSNSTETIWQIDPMNGVGNNAEAGPFLPASATSAPILGLTKGMMALFEDDDRRAEKWIGYFEREDDEPITYPFKYKQRPNGSLLESLVVLRLAEQYLILAEARLETGDLSSAKSALNKIRLRAGKEPLHDDSKRDEIEIALKTERRCELFAEWGHRWCDLKRWEVMEEELAKVKPHWGPTASLFPIPENQIIYNRSLTQNPGY